MKNHTLGDPSFDDFGFQVEVDQRIESATTEVADRITAMQPALSDDANDVANLVIAHLLPLVGATALLTEIEEHFADLVRG